MRNKPTASMALLLTLASIAAQTACTVAPPESALGEPSPTGEPAATADAGAAGLTGAGVTILATVPTGVQCVVATVSGATNETVTASVATGASTVSLAFGLLAPGAITVSGNAYNGACPGTGAPTWNAEAVQATVVEGVATQIQLVFRPAGQTTTGTGIFSLPAIAIAAGPKTTYAVLSDGTVRAWGLNDTGEFGTTTPSSSSTPVMVPGVTNAVQIAAAAQSVCVLRGDSSVACWGYNSNTVLGAPINAVSPPVLSPGLLASQMSGGGGEMLFVGTGTSPTLGVLGTATSAPNGSITWGPTANPMSIAAAGIQGGVGSHCWVTEEQAAFCSFNYNNITNALSGFAQGVTRVFAGSESGTPNACALNNGGSMSCWGANTYGELGFTPSATAQTTAVGVASPAHITALALSRGSLPQAHACIVAAGNVYCAGSGAFGQTGLAVAYPVTSFAVPVSNLPPGIVNVVAGQAHTCALDGQGTVHCWGLNDDGELGDGTTFTRFLPVTVQPW